MPKTKKTRGAKKKSTLLTAKNTHRHALYQSAVQEPEADTRFMEERFCEKFGKSPILLREDFCGTGFLSATWVKEKAHRRAVGYDLDQPTVEWGLENNISPLSAEEKARIELRIADVLEAPLDPVDVVCAMNFSWWIFKDRDQLLNYFRSVRKSLPDEGMFVLDIYGGSEAYIEVEEEHEKELDGEDFYYIWDQDKVCGISDELLCYIHFRFKDGSAMKKAFTYDWRRYGMKESQDLLREAGFDTVEVYWEGSDEDGDGDGEFSLETHAENSEAWIAYLVATP
ncbi:MAG: hypothetical protein CBC13_07255 [Planctomycetia bacterium TMED53]|nr:MAG: hypothetical protein CBC13_07255 [Planctomycetia bacterium TMED53]